jgi:hypothetical protein
MIRPIRVFFEKFSIFCAVVAVVLILANLLEASGLGSSIPGRETLLELVRPISTAFFPTSVYSKNPLEVYPQATLILFLTCLGSSWVCTIIGRLEIQMNRMNMSFLHFFKWLLQMNKQALSTVFDLQDDQPSLSLIFMTIDSPNPDVPIYALVEEVIEKQPHITLLSSQLDAFCFQAASIMEGVQFVHELVNSLKMYNHTLTHPTDAVNFTGVLHSAKSTTAFLDEDAYMRAVLECSGRNQLLVTAEARHAYHQELKQMKEAKRQGKEPEVALPELEMIYHGNYMSMGPRMSECEVYRLVKQL